MVRKTLFSLLIIGSVAAAPVALAQDTTGGTGMDSTGTMGGSSGTMDNSTMGGATGSGMGTTTVEGCETEAEMQTQRCQDLMQQQQGGAGVGTDTTTPGMEGGAGTEGGTGTYGNP